jgi:hypothetical protein
MPWIGFVNDISSRYFFKLRLCKYIEVANYPLIQIGVDWLDLTEAVLFDLAEILTQVPLLMPQGTSLPYANISGTWVCPTDLKFDKASAPIIVNPNDFVALSVIPWTIPTFFESTLEYIPIGAPYSEIPASKTDYWKDTPNGNDAIFMPNKSQYGYGERRVATRHGTYDYTQFSWWGQFIYNNCDLPEEHVVLHYTVSFPVSVDPNSMSYELDPIGSCHSEVDGFPVIPGSSGGVDYIDVGTYGTTQEAEYYPKRDYPASNTPNPFVPFFLVILPLLLGSFGLGASPWVIGALLINGKALTINGKGFKTRKE